MHLPSVSHLAADRQISCLKIENEEKFIVQELFFNLHSTITIKALILSISLSLNCCEQTFGVRSITMISENVCGL